MFLVKIYYRPEHSPHDADAQIIGLVGREYHAMANRAGTGGQWHGRWWWFHLYNYSLEIVYTLRAAFPWLQVSFREALTEEIHQVNQRALDCGPYPRPDK